MAGQMASPAAEVSRSTPRRVLPAMQRERLWTVFWVATCFCFFAACVLFIERTKQLALENQSLQIQLVLQSMGEEHACHPTCVPLMDTLISSGPAAYQEMVQNIARCLQNPHPAAAAPQQGHEPAGRCPVDSKAQSGPQHGDQSSELASTAIITRVMVGICLILSLAAIYFVLQNLDDLPDWMNDWITLHLLGDLDGGSVTKRLQQGDKRVPLSKLLAYKLDIWFSTNPYSKTLSLLYITLGMIVLGGLGIFTMSTVSLDDALWEAIVGVGLDWTFPSDADPEDQDTGLRVMMVRFMGLVVSVGGMLVTALMLGIVSDAISDKVDQLKKGKSEVLEKDHTLILGWSDKLYGLIKELANANESIGGGAIVIMSERDKELMEDDIAAQEIDMRGSRIICRNGNPLLAVDLYKVSVQTARSIVILAQQFKPGVSADVADAFTLRIVMSLMSIHQKQPEGLHGHLVAEVCDLDNEPLLKTVSSTHRLETVVAHDIIGRLMIQSRRQPGLASVWEDLLGFDGNEFYSQAWPELIGKQFHDVLLSFPDAVPIGIVRGDDVDLNPSDFYVLKEGDEVLVLAEDDDTYSPAECPSIPDTLQIPEYEELPIKERILFVGWRRDMDDMIMVLDEFVVQGSELWLYSNVSLDRRSDLLKKGGLELDSLRNLKLIYDTPQMLGEATDRVSLRRLKPERFSTILILADENNQTDQMADADSRSLATLLLIREIQTESARMTEQASPSKKWMSSSPDIPWYQRLRQHKCVEHCMVISEILDSRTRHLISELNISEYVLSNEIISMALAMVSENAAVNQILRELFTEDGNELYVHSAARYFFPGETLSFFELVRKARQNAEIVIGYKTFQMSRPIVNPPDKNERNLSLDVVEQVVVLSEQDSALEAALKVHSGRMTPQTSRKMLTSNTNRQALRAMSPTSSDNFSPRSGMGNNLDHVNNHSD